MVVAAGPLPVAGYVVAMTELRPILWWAGVSKISLDGSGRFNSNFATPLDLVFPECEYSIIWRCPSTETGVKKLPKVVHAIDRQVSTRVCI